MEKWKKGRERGMEAEGIVMENCITEYTLSLSVFNLARIDTLAGHINQLLLLPDFSSWWPSRMLVSYTQRPLWAGCLDPAQAQGLFEMADDHALWKNIYCGIKYRSPAAGLSQP